MILYKYHYTCVMCIPSEVGMLETPITRNGYFSSREMFDRILIKLNQTKAWTCIKTPKDEQLNADPDPIMYNDCYFASSNNRNLLASIFPYDSSGEFYILAVAIGLVQGGVQALSRAFYSRIIPASRAAEFFGFYNMLGKFAAVIGPILMGLVGVATGNPRHSILSIVVLFLAGGIILYFGDEKEGARLAQELEGEGLQ